MFARERAYEADIGYAVHYDVHTGSDCRLRKACGSHNCVSYGIGFYQIFFYEMSRSFAQRSGDRVCFFDSQRQSCGYAWSFLAHMG